MYGIQNNVYIFVTRRKHLQISLKHLLYPATITRPEHRALANVKEGDICFLYEMDSRILYGIFEAEGRVFEDPTNLGFEKKVASQDSHQAVWPISSGAA